MVIKREKNIDGPEERRGENYGVNSRGHSVKFNDLEQIQSTNYVCLNGENIPHCRWQGRAYLWLDLANRSQLLETQATVIKTISKQK